MSQITTALGTNVPSSLLAAAPGGWMGATQDWSAADWVLVGMPYDGTTSYRPGTRFAPAAIRNESFGIETYSPLQNQEIGVDTQFFDAGELPFPFGNREAVLAQTKQAAQAVYNANKKWLGIGGEHLLSLHPVLEAYKRWPNMRLLQFDAHTDLREEYLGEPLSHATVMRRILDELPPAQFAQVGIRSGMREEWDFMRAHNTLKTTHADLLAWLNKDPQAPLFITIDLDVLDPSIFPGTGTPEPGGLSYGELINWLLLCKGRTIIGADVMELSPHYDASGVSTIVAAKVMREVMLLPLL